MHDPFPLTPSPPHHHTRARVGAHNQNAGHCTRHRTRHCAFLMCTFGAQEKGSRTSPAARGQPPDDKITKALVRQATSQTLR